MMDSNINELAYRREQAVIILWAHGFSFNDIALAIFNHPDTAPIREIFKKHFERIDDCIK